MSDREEREEHIKRLEAALACEEKQFSGKCSKAECDDNCALLYEQGNWGEWKDTLRYAIESLKTDLKYDLLYEETSGQADKQADKPITNNDCETCIHNKGVLECDMYGCKYEPATKNDLPHCQHTDEEIAKSFIEDVEAVKEQLPNKDNLGVDCISRTQTQTEIEMHASRYTISRERGYMGHVEWSDQLIKVSDAVDIIRNLPSVTPQEPRWIPVNERLPEYMDTVLTWDGGAFCIEKRIPYILDADGEPVKSDWWVGDEYVADDFDYYPNLRDGAPIAWMPLPKPYEPQESEE